MYELSSVRPSRTIFLTACKRLTLRRRRPVSAPLSVDFLFPVPESEHCSLSDRRSSSLLSQQECRKEKPAIAGELGERRVRAKGKEGRREQKSDRMLATTARRCSAGAAKRASRQAAAAAAGATRHKSAVAAAASSESVKNFKIYRWDPNEKVSLLICTAAHLFSLFGMSESSVLPFWSYVVAV